MLEPTREFCRLSNMAKTSKKSRYAVEAVLDGDVVPIRSFDGEFMAALYAVKLNIRVRDTVTGREFALTSAAERVPPMT